MDIPSKDHMSQATLWLLAGISGLCGLGWLINSVRPHTPVALIGFFVLLFVTVYGIMFFFMRRTMQTLLVATGVIIFFLLRFLGLREWLYFVLLVASLVSLEILFQKR